MDFRSLYKNSRSISDQINQSLIWTHASLDEIRQEKNLEAVNMLDIPYYLHFNRDLEIVQNVYFFCFKYTRIKSMVFFLLPDVC